MTLAGEDTPDAYDDAMLAARLCAVDPRLGGIVLRGGSDLRDRVIAELRTAMPDGAPMRRLPPHVDDEALLGGLDLGATLASGRMVARVGLLAEVEGGVIVAPMAERMQDSTAARIAAALDGGARFLTVALDDGIEPDEIVPAVLGEWLAFRIDLSSLSIPAEAGIQSRNGLKEKQPERSLTPAFAGVVELSGTDAPPTAMEAIATTAAALGIDSARAALFALRAARAAAALAGRDVIADEDVILAARLVLAPRATRFPPEVDRGPAPPPPEYRDDPSESQDSTSSEPLPLDDIVLAATLAALPADVLARIAGGQGRRGAVSRVRGAGEQRRSPTRGRPVGVRAGVPRGGLRLSLIDTLRAAAPWQKVRGRDGARILIRRDDLRIRRFETRAEAVTIFAVDASGSSALARLAEAKGAVELLLAEAYVKRAQVALIAFRGGGADILLPPTRSLARARRALADLPGGGGTPLAAGLEAAQALAADARMRGRTPFVVVLTDGRANVALDGSRGAAVSDAEAAARAIGAAGIAGAFVDISPRPRADGERLAAAMGARYLALPRADASAMHAGHQRGTIVTAAPRWEIEGRDWPNREASRFVTVGRLRFHVQVMGAGPVMLLLHGTGSATHSWRDLMPLLAEHFTVVAPDLPGHGFTIGRPNGGLSMRAMARSIGDLMTAMGLAPEVIVGHSAGAAIAIRMVIDGLATPRGIVGLDAAILPLPGLAARLFPTLARMLFVNPLAPHIFAALARNPGETGRFLRRSTGSTIDSQGVALYARLFATPAQCSGAITMMADWDLDSLARDLPRLAAPLLLVHGTADAAIPIDTAKRAAALVKDGRLAPLEGLGHLAHEERPGEVAALIAGFAEVQGTTA